MARRTLAELCGLSKSAISRYERGERVPTLEAVIALAGFFDVSIDELLGESLTAGTCRTELIGYMSPFGEFLGADYATMGVTEVLRVDWKEAVLRILDRGSTAEVKKTKDGIIVLDVIKKTEYRPV